jgi:methionyl-tRNA formyltransferase
MRVVYFGSGEFAVPCLRWLINSPHEIVRVVTQPDRPAGRGKKTRPTAVAAKAEEHDLSVERIANANEPSVMQRLRGLKADVGVVAAFGQKMSRELLDSFKLGCFNLHASLLPKYRGAAPIHRAILEGEEKTGVTTFWIVEKMDAGPILVQRETQIGPEETASDLHDRLSRIGCDALDATMKLLKENPNYPGQPQDESKVTFAPKLTKEDGYLRFDEPAEKIANRCRAMWEWPGARCRYVSREDKETEVTLVGATPLPTDVDETPGTITSTLSVAAAKGSLEIHSLKPAGKRLMSWQDFVNGRHVRPGDRFESMKA